LEELSNCANLYELCEMKKKARLYPLVQYCDCKISNIFALCSPKIIHGPPIPRDHGEILGRLDGVGKVACWSTNAAISLKRVKIEEKLL